MLLLQLPDPTSGSGSGMPKLVKRTVAKSVTLLDQIGWYLLNIIKTKSSKMT